MRLSVVVPLFNCLPLTRAMLASLRATLPADLDPEIILVDDGSTDGTREWLAGLKSPFRVVLNDRNRGYAAANNRGAAIATGTHLALLNNDLILKPRWIEPMLKAHAQLADRAGLVGNVQLDAHTRAVDHAGIFINHKGKPEHLRSRPGWMNRLWHPVRNVTAVTGACALVSRALWEQLGGFDEGYVNGCEDVDFCLRAAAIGRAHVVALNSTVLHHVSQSPGRKARDEANTYRLTLRWHDTLLSLGLDAWCRHQFEIFSREPETYLDRTLARELFRYVTDPREMPAQARVGMRASIERELARWREMFGECPAPS